MIINPLPLQEFDFRVERTGNWPEQPDDEV